MKRGGGFCLADRQTTDAIAVVLNRGKSAISELGFALLNHLNEPGCHEAGRLVSHSKQNHRGTRGFGKRHDLAEVEIEGQNDPSFASRFRDDAGIFHSYQALFAEMNYVVSELSKGRDRGHRDAHVGEESHAAVGANG